MPHSKRDTDEGSVGSEQLETRKHLVQSENYAKEKSERRDPEYWVKGWEMSAQRPPERGPPAGSLLPAHIW